LALIRRGSALCWTGRLKEGTRDYTEAVELQRAEVAAVVGEDAAAMERRSVFERELVALEEDQAAITRLVTADLD
jgi:hypothetical protein